MKYRVRHVLEYGALRAVAAVAGILPGRAALALAAALAWVACFLFRFRAAETDRRIRAVFGESLPRRRRRAIAWQSLRNTAFTAVEAMRTSAMPATARAIAAANAAFMERLRAHRASGRGAILALPHMGAWDLAGGACGAAGLPVFSIAGRQRNPLFDRYLNGQRERLGMPILMRGDSTLRQVLRRLKDGEFLAILLDVRMPTPALSIAFLGGTANIGAGAASFARRARVPIFPCIVTRTGWTGHRLTLGDPVWPDPAADADADASRMTQAVFRGIEEAIRRDPGQWFWYNRRWVLEPLPGPGGGQQPAAPRQPEP